MNELKVDSGDDVPAQRVRTKRCACSSPLDSECHYFCHLDIIWINTPRWGWEKSLCGEYGSEKYVTTWQAVNYNSLFQGSVWIIKEQSLHCVYTMNWVLIPLCSKTTLYGLGSILSRRRRSTGRCACANPEDQSCTNFCRHRWVWSRSTETKSRHQASSQRPSWTKRLCFPFEEDEEWLESQGTSHFTVALLLALNVLLLCSISSTCPRAWSSKQSQPRPVGVK